MRAAQVMANLRVADVEAAKSFYTDYLGLGAEEFSLRLGRPLLLSRRKRERSARYARASASEDSVISVRTDDVEGAYTEAQELGLEIVHPLTTEPWGVRRFFLRSPDGSVINIVKHRD